MVRPRSPHTLIVFTVALLILINISAASQPRFDTQIANANGKVFTSINQNLIDILSLNGGLFDRSQRNFEIGLNWDGIDNKHAKTVLGVSILDVEFEHVENGTNTANNITKLTNCPTDTRFIAIERAAGAGQNLLFDMGFSAATRVDFELNVNDQTDEPDLEAGTNTGAIHGFDTVGNGTVNGKHVELRRSQGPSVYADNSNQRIWSTTSSREHKRNNDAKIDPMRSGEMIVVGVCLRRSGVVPDDGDPQAEESDFDVPVMSVRIRRQQRLLEILGQKFVDEPRHQYLRFSFVPACEVGVDYAAGAKAPNQIGVDDLPHLFNDLATPPTGETEIDSKFINRAVYKDMPLMDAQSKALDVTGREFVWEHMKDVRAVETYDNQVLDDHEEIVITKGMLRRLRDNAANPGNTSDPYDGISNWTIFEGLLVFGAVNQSKVDHDLFVYDETASPATYGFGSALPNLRFVEGGRRGRADGNYSLGETDITNLRVEVVYYDEADVDVDYVVLQTPNGRALLRDQFRDSISASIARTVHAFSASTATVGGDHKLLGIRSAEEVGETYWYAQRYLNILTNGAMLSEISIKPYSRYKHCVYPFTSSGGSYPANPLPLWTWNEGSTGRPDPLNPVPFLKNGGQAYSKYYASGYKYGVCGGSWSNNGVYTATESGPCKFPSGPGAGAGRRLRAHDHDIGWPCESSTLGSKKGWFAHFKQAPEKYWADVKFYEVENTDWLNSPLDPVDENAWPNAPENSGGCLPNADDMAAMSSHLDWPPTLLTSVSLHNNYIYRGNANFLFDGHSWLEQVWLGTDKDYVRGPTTNDPNDVMTVQVSGGDQARPLTGEEIRLKLMAPTLLGADGLMLYVGNYGLDDVNDIGKQRFQVLFNLNNNIDAHDPNATLASVEGRMRSPVYGKDFPTFNGSLKTLAAQHTVPINNVAASVKTEGYVEDHYPGPIVNGVRTAEKLWISKYAYTDINGNSIGGLDLVRRVHPSGTLYTTSNDVEKVYIGSQSGRFELLRYTDWLKSTLQDYDNNGPDPLPENRTDNTDLDIRDEPQSVRELLALLDLHSWFSKGYKQHGLWREKAASAPDPMLSWLDLSRLRTRHPNRVHNARADYEDADSTFVDVTLHYRRPNLADEPYAPYTPFSPDPFFGQYVKDEIYIGVQNRRQNPLYMVDDDQPKFSSTEEFFALVSRSSNGHGLYDQLGSRTVILPFEHEKSPTEPVLLHVTEVGDGEGTDGRDFVYYEHNDNGTVRQTKRRMIDTIIDGYGSLEVNLLPGEGRLLRVKVLPAVSTDQIVGNLAFNGQTKLVVAPEQTVDFSVVPPVVTHNDEKLVYHMAYTREVNGFLRVFYRPSLAYHRDHVPEVAGLKWGQEVEIGGSMVVRKGAQGNPGTIWQSANHQFDDCYPGVIPGGVGYLEYPLTHDGQGGEVSIESAFPSIAIARNVVVDAQGVEHSEQRVHIVYSSLVYKDFYGEGQNAPERVGEQHIVETTFRAGATPVAADVTTRSLSVIGTQGAAAFNHSWLTNWGTPTNGVSTAGVTQPPVVPRTQPDRVFTAWSVRQGVGITSGVRQTWGGGAPIDGGYFTGPVNGLNANIDQFDITQVFGEDRWVAYAQYPSLTPTNTAVGGSTPAASLVWQEQAKERSGDTTRFNGWAIMYTRVWEDGSPNPAFGEHDYGFDTNLKSMPYLSAPYARLSVFESIGAMIAGSVHHNYVMRVSQAEPDQVSLYPTIARSGLGEQVQAPMFMLIEQDSEDDTFYYQFESLTWQSVSPLEPMVRVQRRHFIHHDATLQPGPGNGMRHWVVGSSHSSMANFIAPTISNGAFRLDEQLYVNPYDYNQIKFFGNVSDTAMFSSFGVVYGDLSNQGIGMPPNGTLDWENWSMPQDVWQVHLRYVPVPAISGSYVPYGDGYNNTDRKSRSKGIWPHLSHQGFGLNQAKQNVRRVQHSSGASQFSSILVSAEGFYKERSSSVWQTKAGYFDGEEVMSVGGWLDNGEEVEFRREHRQTTPLESMFLLAIGPTEDLVSQPFSVSSYREVKLDVDGVLRDDLTLTVEEVDLDGRPLLDRSANVGLPEKPQKTARTSRKTAEFTFVGGATGSRYRFRLHPSKNLILNVEEVLNDVAGVFAKERNEDAERVVVDLDRMEVARPSSDLNIRLLPNPADDVITLIPVGTSAHTGTLRVDIYTSTGDNVATTAYAGDGPIELDVSQLTAGVYSVIVTGNDGQCVLVRCVIL